MGELSSESTFNVGFISLLAIFFYTVSIIMWKITTWNPTGERKANSKARSHLCSMDYRPRLPEIFVISGVRLKASSFFAEIGDLAESNSAFADGITFFVLGAVLILVGVFVLSAEYIEDYTDERH